MGQRIGLQIALNGAKEVIEELRHIEKFGNKLEAKTWKMRVDLNVNNLKRGIDEINKSMLENEKEYLGLLDKEIAAKKSANRKTKEGRHALAEQLWGIRIQKNENRRARKDMQIQAKEFSNAYQELQHEFQANKIRFDIDDAAYQEELKVIEEKTRATMDKIARIGKDVGLGDSRVSKARGILGELRGMGTHVSTDAFTRMKERAKIAVTDMKRYISELERNIREVNESPLGQDHAGKALVEGWKRTKAEVEAIVRDINNEIQGKVAEKPIEIPVEPKIEWGKLYNKWSGNAARLGSSMITAGNTLQRVTMPFDSIVRGAAYGIGYGALNKVTEGLSSSFQRYDTLENFPKIMSSLGFDPAKAEKSKKALDDAVQGLPTGLDEIIDMAKRYTLATHDIEEGTNVAIAANNAFLASASTDQQKYQGMMQLNDVLTGKKLQTREWMSLAAAMPAAIQEIGKELKYTDNSEFLQALYGNKVDNKKFLKALVKVGTEQGKIAEMAEISKLTFQGLGANIKNAFSRGGYKMLKALNDVFVATTEKGTIENFLEWKDGIDVLFDSAAEWVRNNPEVIMGFFDRIKSFDWKGLVSGFGRGLLGAGKILGRFMDLMDAAGVDAASLGTKLVKWNLIGKILTVLGGFAKGGAPLVGLGGMLGKFLKIGGIGTLISKVISPLSKIGKAKAALEGAETVAEVGKTASKMATSWQDVASKAVGIAAIPAIAGSFLLAAKALKELDGIDMNWSKFAKNMEQMAIAVGAFGTVAGILGTLATKTGIGATVAGGVVVGSLIIDAVAQSLAQTSKAVGSLARAVGAWDTVKIPTMTKVKEVIASAKEIAVQLQNSDLPDVKKGSGENAKGIAGVLEGIASMLTNTKAISEIEIGKKQIKQAKKSIGEIRPMIEEMKEEIAQLYGDESFNTRTNHRGQKVETTHRNKFDSKALENAQTDTGGVNSVLGNVLSFIGSMKKLSKKAEELKSLDIPALTDTIGTSISDMGTIAERIKQQSERLDGIKDAPERFTAMLTSIGSIKKILTKLQEMDESGIMASSTNRMLTLGNIIEQMSSALSKAGGGMINAAMFESMTASVKKGINNLNKINEVKIDFGGFEQTVASAVKVVKSATKKISKAWGNFKSATDEIKNISKSIFVAVHINGVDSAVDQMNSAASRLNAARANLNAAMNGGGGGGGGGGTVNPVLHTGGYLDGRGRVLYRASGGGVPLFKRKGMDTVPAMLTPGEYVNRRAAVEHFGAGFFERLNHLDLEGALRNISTRASRFAGGNTYNITNKTNNARVVQHIHTHDTNYAFKRANRFVEAL